MYAIGLYEFLGGILGTLVHRGRARQCDQRRAIFKCRQLSDIIACSNSESLFAEKDNQFVESLEISKKTSDNPKKLERMSRWKICEIFSLLGIFSYARPSPATGHLDDKILDLRIMQHAMVIHGMHWKL